MAYIKKKTLPKQEIAYQKIKNAIINNEYDPNTMLIESELSEKLGFSKTPIREALRRLESEKYIEYLPEKGNMVAKMGLEDFVEMYDVREALEGMAARLCALKQNERVIRLLDETFTKWAEAIKNQNNEKDVKEDSEFHLIVINGSGNSKLISSIKGIMDQINRFAITTVNDPERLQLSFEQHKSIWQALKKKDADLAEQTMREHIRSVKEYQLRKHYLLGNMSYK